jgi:serine/threonine protein phosphatase PrpC
LIAAVADGHGDEKHDRSQFGAALAVRAAVEELYGLQAHYGISGASSRLVNTFKTDFPRRLGRRWREAVIGDAQSRLPEGSGEAREDPELFSRYGTTLLAALVVGDALLVGQIGDGTTILLGPDEEVDCPLACANEDVGIVTDSLCTAGADRRWRTAVRDCSAGGLLFLSTDGLVNAFIDEQQLFAFTRSFRDRISEFGLLQVASSLPMWLDRYSDQGSGDDITLAVLMIQSALPGRKTEKRAVDVADTDINDPSQGAVHVTGDRTTGLCGDGEKLPSGEEKVG